MSDILNISPEKIIEQIKLSCQLPSIIQGIATRQIILHASAEAGIKAEAKELQQAADSIRLANKLHKIEDTWLWLEKNGLSIEDFEELVRYQVLSTKLAEYLFADTIEPFFVANQLDFTQAAIYEVFLNDEDLAMELYYAISEGEISFPEVAHQYIQDREKRRVGGYLGLVNRQQLKPEISAAVFSATPPTILKPIVTSRGVRLIFVEEIIQPELNEQLRQKIIADAFANWIKQQMAQIQTKSHTANSQNVSPANQEALLAKSAS